MTTEDYKGYKIENYLYINCLDVLFDTIHSQDDCSLSVVWLSLDSPFTHCPLPILLAFPLVNIPTPTSPPPHPSPFTYTHFDDTVLCNTIPKTSTCHLTEL